MSLTHFFPIFSVIFGGVTPLYEYLVKNDLDIFLGFLGKKTKARQKKQDKSKTAEAIFFP